MVDFSGTKWPYVSFGGPRFTPLFYKVTGSVKGGTAEYHPFPPASKGFLYFHRKPGRESNIFSGEIRFRVVVNSSDSEFSADKLFADGHDLLDLSGLAPWRIHMVNLFVSKAYEPIRDLLVHQGFITSEQVSQGKRVVSETGWTRAPAQERILENMTDEFVLSFPPGRITLTFPRSDAIAQYFLSPWMGLYEKGLSDGSQSEPRQYHGNAIVRFELARVPLRKGGNEHIAMVLRVLRLPSPDRQGNPDGIPFHLPDGGELLQSSPGFVRGFKLKSASKHLPPSALEVLERKYLPRNSL
ncbi:hypothetical protein D9611_006697 [Ephemerocybe angulata]|uniref:Uncharacterized protein n=1 Tax=Ephemerocybe angulata TaxID=980116 RepID=A0A8H5C7G7_9AGAR|nr:hypothetical protein D9611_006697 [Tulosesus angulatus]